jgi:hypothetical protein
MSFVLFDSGRFVFDKELLFIKDLVLFCLMGDGWFSAFCSFWHGGDGEKGFLAPRLVTSSPTKRAGVPVGRYAIDAIHLHAPTLIELGK